MSVPDPKAVVAHQLRMAKTSIIRARQDKSVTTDVQSALNSLHTAVEALAKLAGVEAEPASAHGYVAPLAVPREPNDPNPATMDF